MSYPNATKVTLALYQSVIKDVIENVGEAFADEGVEEAVLKELKELWETKLALTKVVEQQPTYVVKNSAITPNLNTKATAISALHAPVHTIPQQLPYQTNSPALAAVVNNPSFVQFPVAHIMPVGAAPAFAFTANSVPATSARLVSGMPIAATTTLTANPSTSTVMPVPAKTDSLDEKPIKYLIVPQQVLATSSTIAQVTPSNNNNSNNNDSNLCRVAPPATSSASSVNNKPKNPIVQLDGPGDMSDDEEEKSIEDESDNLNEADEAEEEDETNCAAGLVEEGDPLNSEDDDLANENADELFEAEDIIVCQYEKIDRTRNKWKFLLKDGVMHLKGKDFVFNKAIGESEF